jgi:hypothetical protein
LAKFFLSLNNQFGSLQLGLQSLIFPLQAAHFNRLRVGLAAPFLGL